MKIRKSTDQDLERIMEIYSYARNYMAEHGNPNQWGPTNWPPEDLIRNDIRDGNSYVCLNEEGTVIGTFFFLYGENIEPAYREISNGAWLDDSHCVANERYMTKAASAPDFFDGGYTWHQDNGRPHGRNDYRKAFD